MMQYLGNGRAEKIVHKRTRISIKKKTKQNYLDVQSLGISRKKMARQRDGCY